MAYTIRVQLNSGAPPTLTYPGDPPNADGEPVSAKRHHIFRNGRVRWICHEGDLFIVFLGVRAPFKNRGANPVLTAAIGTHTDTVTVKNKVLRESVKYIAAVVTPAGSGVGVFEDPILEDGGDPGGDGKTGRKKKPTKKKASKKTGAKKKTKKK